MATPARDRSGRAFSSDSGGARQGHRHAPSAWGNAFRHRLWFRGETEGRRRK
jgi:hypothetical protein